jgi:hypothetical protein
MSNNKVGNAYYVVQEGDVTVSAYFDDLCTKPVDIVDLGNLPLGADSDNVSIYLKNTSLVYDVIDITMVPPGDTNTLFNNGNFDPFDELVWTIYGLPPGKIDTFTWSISIPDEAEPVQNATFGIHFLCDGMYRDFEYVVNVKYSIVVEEV